MNNLYLPPARSAELLPSDPYPISQYANYGIERSAGQGPMEYWSAFRRWKWTLISWAIIGIGVGLLATLLEPRRYEGKATLEVQDLNDNFLDMKQVLPVNEVGLSGTFNDMQTQVKIVQSDSVVNPVMRRMPGRVAQIGPSNESIVARAKRLAGMQTPPAKFDDEDAKKLADTLKVRAVGQTRVIEITADWSDSRVAADFVNQICAEYMDQNMKARWEMGQRTSESLSRWLEDTKAKLRTSEDALQEYAKTSGLLMTTEKAQQTSVADEKLSQIQEELSKAEAERIEAQSRYEMARTNPTDGAPDELGQNLLRDYQSKLTELQRQRAELSATYTDDYGKIKRLDSEIASVQAAIQAEQRSVVQRAENQYHAASRREKLLSSRFASQTGVVTDLDQRAVQYHILEHQVESNQQLYDEMLKQAKEATIASAMSSSNIRIVDPAEPPKLPYSPKPALSCALGLVLCSFLGVLIGLARDRADSSLKEPGDSYQLLGLPEMGVMLRDSSGAGLLHSPVGQSLQQAQDRSSILGGRPFGRAGNVTEGGGGGLWQSISSRGGKPIRTPLLALESCRAVVTSILSGTDGKSPRLLVVTSPGPGEGKTTVVANLGLTLALIGKRVLLVDADVRRHQLHKFFGLHDERGLCSMLEKSQTINQSLDSFVQKTAVPGLSVLSSGASATATANLLYSPDLPKLLARLKGEYDFVLIDSPPVFPVADARIVGRFADGVILVARAGQTAREAAGAAHRRLAADEVRVLGLILNDWDPRSSAHTYYADYTREYGDLDS